MGRACIRLGGSRGSSSFLLGREVLRRILPRSLEGGG